ncbi:hypothetical protein [Lentisalinibacter sediminis]|uniref:hypothetical protein n=1 Tax=Lentisalinibacter sediminis TaxID=2992237 RepID=UPI0038636A49
MQHPDQEIRNLAGMSMYVFLLVLMWVTPAVIAGTLGWTGIWGTNPAFLDYLIPSTVTGGLLHLPSFAVGALAVRYLRDSNEGSRASWVGAIAAMVMLSALVLQIDFRDLNLWLYTDYQPHGFPIEFEGTALFLFIASDAFWVLFYAIAIGAAPGLAQSALAPLIPAAIIAFNVLGYQSQGVESRHVFHYGYSMRGEQQGQDQAWVYTPTAYDETLFRNWLEESDEVQAPWNSSTAQHLAVYFVDSMDSIKRLRRDDTEHVVATLCLYEEDRSVVAHEGMADCFSTRPTLVQRVAHLRDQNPTGLGPEIDQWYAYAVLCADVSVPEERDEVALHSVCRRFLERQADFIGRMQTQFGPDSEPARFVREESAALGLPTEPGQSPARTP